MTKQELCFLTFYRYYRYTQLDNVQVYPNLKSIDNIDNNPRIHLQTDSPIDIEAHFNQNSVRMNYFFNGEAFDLFENFIALHFPLENTPFHGDVGNNTYYFTQGNTASIECHVRFDADGGGQPDPDKESVRVLGQGFDLGALTFGNEANGYVDQIIDRWKEMLDDLAPLN